MFRIHEAQFIAPDVKRFRIEAPRIARKRQAGQFVILRIHEHGERIPLTIADSDVGEGTITIIVQGVGKTTHLLNRLEAGDAIQDVVGPLGQASEIELFGTVVVIGGGVGTAIAYPTAVALKQAGNVVIGIVGARTNKLLILEEEMRATTDVLYVMSDDGTVGEKGLVTTKLQQLIDEGRQIDRVLAIGPIPMMKAVADVSRELAIPTSVSLNPVMVDGTGMCGGCRVIVGGESRFACVDGPEFDAHQVDFEVLRQRNAIYRQREQHADAEFQRDPTKDLNAAHACRLTETGNG
ncbi:MAG: sulfide/dihydroorotate dehydrogenase-like FAD/NAD-binding protein [Pirellulaceae bacterium]